MTDARRAGLLDWARRERAGWETILAEVGANRMNEPGPMGDWTFRDLLCHLTAWQRFAQLPFEQVLTGTRPAPPWPTDLNPEKDQTRINQYIYDQTRGLPLVEVIQEGRLVWDRLEEGIAALPASAMSGNADDLEPLGARVVREATAHFHQDHEVAFRAWLAGFRAPADDV